MKQILLFVCAAFFSFSIGLSQAPQYIPYQAVARDVLGNLLVNQAVTLRFTIHDVSGTGTVLYQEKQSATTNNLGLFSVNIGNGTVLSGTFSTIPWGNGNAKFIQVEVDPAGGTSYTNLGAAQMMSVPYALYAGTATSASSIPLANPTGSIGMTANNGSATTAMRSDGTPAINAGIAPTWTGVHTFSNSTYSALFTGGNVGIGTSTPAAMLHVVTTDQSTGLLTAWGTGEFVVGKGSASGGGIGLSYDGTNNVGTIYSLAPNVAYKDLALRANNIVLYYTGGTEGLRLTTTGALAIGGSTNYGTAGNHLISNGNTVPTWGSLNLAGGANYISGILPVANGGTGTSTAFTQGSVPFAASGGSLAQNNGSFFWDNTNIRLGIGTSGPGVPLDVIGTGNIGIRYIISGAADGRISVGDNSGQRWSWSCGWGAGGGGAAGDFSLVHESSSGSVIYFQNSTNNVGIGTVTPAYKLDVSGTERVTGALTVGGTASFSGSTYSALFSGGTVGIGTSTPDQALTIDGTTPIVEIKSGGYLQLRPTANGWDMRLQATGQQLNILSGGNLSTPIMSLVNGGNVGIGTSAPAYPLDVEAYYTFTSGYSSYGALYSGGATYISGSSGTNTPVSIHTNYRMTANEFDAVSDKRIKDIIDISNPVADLATLGKLEVTDFKYKDRIAHGYNTKKGFIAQQVETVFPEAINKMSDFIPDIYTPSKTCSFDQDKHSLTVTLAKPHNLVAGNKVRIMNGANSKEALVNEIISDVQFSVGGWDSPTDKVFVFGKQVNDFRTVDYDRVYTLNVSATQELARQVKALQAENAELKCKNDELAAKTGAKADASELILLRQQVEELKRLMQTNIMRGEK